MKKDEALRREEWAGKDPLVLKQFQKALLDSLKGEKRVALYSGLGTGKTITSLAKANEINSPAVLVVCQVSQVEEWVLNALRQCKGRTVYNLRNKAEFDGFMADDGARLGVINYDLVWRKAELKKLKDFTLILDESSLISNRSSKRTKFCLKIGRNAEGVICASGTPCSGRYEGLISQCWLLNWQVGVQEFWDRYVIYSTWSPPGTHAQIRQVKGYKNTDDLIRNLEERCHARFLRSDAVLDLPDENDTDIFCDVTREYKEFLKNYYIRVSDDVELIGDSSMARRIYLRQLAGAYNPGKETALMELLERTEDRIIIFYNYEIELAVIKRVCQKLNKYLLEQNGRTHQQEDFKKIPGSVLAVQYQSGGRGLNLQCCNAMVFFSPSDSCELYTQARGRIRRMGQTRPCHYYHLICQGSIDERIREAVQNGQDYTETLFLLDFPGRKNHLEKGGVSDGDGTETEETASL